jgi:hypothetical protein
MPTAPSVDPAMSGTGANAGVMMRELGTPEEMSDPAISGGSYQKPVDPQPQIFIPAASGPGNSDWGHSRKRHNK